MQQAVDEHLGGRDFEPWQNIHRISGCQNIGKSPKTARRSGNSKDLWIPCKYRIFPVYMGHTTRYMWLISHGSHGCRVQYAEDLGNKARERSGTVDDMKQLQEPLALTEHREKKWESTAARLN